jgi:heat shock protein HslJ
MLMRQTAWFVFLIFAACVAQSTAASLDGTSWTLTTSPHITLQFADGRASGSGGCNQYHGTYTVSGSSLTFGPTASTRRACAEDERNRQETQYFDALSRVAAYEVAGERLTLRDAAGATLLEFTARE